MARHSVLEPPAGHPPGAVLRRDAGPAPGAAVGCLVLLLVCAGGGAVQLVLTSLGYADPVVLLGVLGGAALCGLFAFRAARGLRGLRAGARRPDVLAVDGHGVAARCAGRPPFRYAWSQVRRLDAGAGRETGWLRLWLVAGVPGPEGLPAARRTNEGALLLLRFGPGAEREPVAGAVRRYAPRGVRVRL
jgi:hypothetical protein